MSCIGPYRLGELLGAGGMGSVHRAEHVELEVAVALKVLPRSTRPGFEGEVAALAALTHPGIVQIIDCGVLERPTGIYEAGTPWIAMEELGLDLAAAPPPPERVLATLRQVLHALAHAHGSGLLHLDIKPSNLLWREDRAVLADFGLARRDPASISHVSAPFAAPEQLADGTVGPWTDLFALGRTLERWTLADSGLDRWLARAAALAPSDRFASAAEALAALPDVDRVETASTVSIEPTRKRTDVPGAFEPSLPRSEWLIPSAEPPPPPPVRRLHRGAGLGVVQQRTLPLLGREAQQKALWEALRRVARERRSLVVDLVGPSGSGRTSIAAWLGRAAHADCGALVLDVPTHDELAPALRSAVASHPLGTSASGLAKTWLDGHLPPSLAPRALVDWIAGRLTVLLVEGGRAAGDLSGLDAPLLVLTTGAASRDATVELPPVAAEAIQDALTALLGLDAPTANTLAHAANGNPGVALALVEHALDTGSLRPAQHGFTQTGPLQLPRSLIEPMQARILHFPPEERAVLAVAGLLGPVFDEAALPQPTGPTRTRALTEGVWRRAGDHWRWTSDLLRQAAIDADPRPLPQLHLVCAERLPPGLQRAIHLAHAGQPEALDALYTGFKRALGQQDLLAARRAERAARALDLPSTELRPALMRARLAWTQNHDQAALDELTAIEPVIGQASRTAQNDFLLVKGNVLANRMHLEAALACYDAVELRDGETQHYHLARGRARCLGWAHREAEALQVIEACMQSELSVRQRHDLELVRATTLHTLQRHEEAEQSYRSLLRATPILAYQAASNLADLLRQQGDVQGSREAYARAAELAASAGAELSFATVCAPLLDAEHAPARVYARLREAIAATASDAVAAFGHFGCLQCCPDVQAFDEHWARGFALLPELPSDPDSIWFMERARDHAFRRGWADQAQRVESVLVRLPR